MEVTWLDDGVDLLDGDGRVTERSEQLLRHELREERLAVVTLLGPRSAASARRRLVAELLGKTTGSVELKAGATLLAWATHVENDYTLVFVDVSDASLPIVGALCALSSLVMSACDADTGAAYNLPGFPAFQETLRLLQRDHSAIELFDLLPAILSIYFSHEPRRTDAWTAPSSSTSGSSLAEMTRLKMLPPRTAEELAAACVDTLFAPMARVKKVFGAELTGELLLALLQSLARDCADGHDPDLSGAWDEFVERKCNAVVEDALATYVDCIQSSLGEDAPPIEMDAFDKLHDELARLAMDVFHTGTNALKAPSRRTVRSRLERDLKHKYNEELRTLREQSRRFCDSVRSDVWRELSAPLIKVASDEAPVCNNTEGSSISFRAALDAIQQFDALYSARARGPEKESVLSDFYRHEAVDIFRMLEGLVSRRMTDAHLRELREQLEKDFEAKKDALVDRFKQEEAQLRACMSREMEMMQKLHLAKNSRAKIDESETKRLREEVAELRCAKSAWESRQVVLEHTSDSAAQQNKALEVKIRDLEQSVRQEMASRAELVDTLAATIKANEDKERHLQDRIAELQIEVNEKASRIENELRDLSLQLRKTSEEKDELQKKLNEFFLRVTALPAALQEHLFCADGSDTKPVGFADALSSYMSQ